MLNSIWSRSPWEAFLFFAIGLALWETVAARAAIRLGSNAPRLRPFAFGSWSGFFFGVALFVYFLSVSGAAFSGVEGNAPSVWEKAKIASFPTSAALGNGGNGVATWFAGATLFLQETILGAAFGVVFRASKLFERKARNAETPSERPDDGSNRR